MWQGGYLILGINYTSNTVPPRIHPWQYLAAACMATWFPLWLHVYIYRHNTNKGTSTKEREKHLPGQCVTKFYSYIILFRFYCENSCKEYNTNILTSNCKFIAIWTYLATMPNFIKMVMHARTHVYLIITGVSHCPASSRWSCMLILHMYMSTWQKKMNVGVQDITMCSTTRLLLQQHFLFILVIPNTDSCTTIANYISILMKLGEYV